MKRALLIALLATTALLLLGAVALGVLLATFNPNDYKPHFSRAVHKATGRELVFEGDIELALFPELGLKTGGLILKDVDGFGAEPFAAVESAVVRVPLEPLLEQSLVLKELTLNGLRLKLAVNAAGEKNWEAGFGAQAGAKPEKVAGEALQTHTGHAAGQQNATAGPVRDSEPLQSSAPPRNSVPLEAPAPQDPAEKTSFSIRLEQIACSGITAQYHDLRDDSGFSATLEDFSLQEPDLDKDIDIDLSGSAADKKSARKGVFTLKARARAARDGSAAALIRQFRLTAEGLAPAPVTLETQGEIAYLANGSLSLRQLAGTVSLPQVRERKAFACAFTGSADARPGKGGRALDVRAALNLDQVDLDTLLNLPTADASSGGPAAGAPNMPRPRVVSGKKTPAAPGKTADGGLKLQGFTADVSLQVDRLALQGHVFSRVKAQLALKDARAELPFDAAIHGGALEGKAVLDASRPIPALALTAEVKDLNLERATGSLTGKYTVTGTASARADVQAAGTDAHAMLATLKGTASARALSGEVRGFTLIPGDLPGLDKAVPDHFPYSQISASAAIASGTATSKDILLASPVLGGRGGGVVRLAQGQMDLGIDFLIGNLPPAVPVSISGPYANLAYSVDMPVFLRNVAQSALSAPESAVDLLRKTPQSAVDLLKEPEKAIGVLRNLGGQLFR